MRKTLLSLLLLLLVAAAPAQELKVTAHNDVGEALSYAYLYINGKAVAVTDSLGAGVIPATKLTIGDTVSVSYVGTDSQQTVYDNVLRTRAKWEVILTEKYHTLTADEIKVRVDVYKLLNKYLRHSFSIFYNNRFSGDFKWEGSKSVEGRFTAEESGRYENRATPSPCTYALHPIALDTQDDTTGVSGRIRFDIRSMLSDMTSINSIFNFLTYDADGFRTRNPKAQLRYLGYKEGLRVFRLTYPMQNGAFQYLAFIDPEAKRVRRVESHLNIPGQDWHKKVSIDFRIFKDERSGVPKSARWANVVILDTGSQVSGPAKLEIRNTDVKILPKDAKKKN